MASALSNLVNNLAEEIDKIKRKYENDDKKYGTCGIKYKDRKCFLKQELSKKVDENLKKRFLIYTHFLTMISISLLCCFKKVFIDMKAWIIGKYSIKHYYLNN